MPVPAQSARRVSGLGPLTQELCWWLTGRRKRFRVRGTSMEPTLRSGEVVLVNPHVVVTTGDLVVSRHPTRDLHVVKQVGRIDQRGRVELVSPRGDDSRVFGPVERTAVLGVVTVNLSTRRRVERRGVSVDPQANTADA